MLYGLLIVLNNLSIIILYGLVVGMLTSLKVDVACYLVLLARLMLSSQVIH
jgi:hypothetical protein